MSVVLRLLWVFMNLASFSFGSNPILVQECSSIYFQIQYECVPCSDDTPALFISKAQDICACLEECEKYKCVAISYNSNTKVCTGLEVYQPAQFGATCARLLFTNRKTPQCPTSTSITGTSITSVTHYNPLPKECTMDNTCNCADSGLVSKACYVLEGNQCYMPIQSPSKDTEKYNMCYMPLNGKMSTWDCAPLPSLIPNKAGQVAWCTKSISTAQQCLAYCQKFLPFQHGSLINDDYLTRCKCERRQTPFFWDSCPAEIHEISCIAKIHTKCLDRKCPRPLSCSAFQIYNDKDCETAGGRWLSKRATNVSGVQTFEQARCEIEEYKIECYIPLATRLSNFSCQRMMDLDTQLCPTSVVNTSTCQSLCWEIGYKIGSLVFETMCTCHILQLGDEFMRCPRQFQCIRVVSTSSSTTTKSSFTLSSTSTSSTSSSSTKFPNPCTAPTPSPYILTKFPCDSLLQIPEGTICEQSCKAPFVLKRGDRVRKCENGTLSGSQLVCGCLEGFTINSISMDCVEIRGTNTFVTQSSVPSFTEASEFTTTSTTSTISKQSPASQRNQKHKSNTGVLVGVVVVIVLLLVLGLALVFVRFRNTSTSKGGAIMDELGMMHNPTYEAASANTIKRDSNPLYEDGSGPQASLIPRQNNPMYEGGAASGTGSVQSIQYEPVQVLSTVKNQEEESVLVAAGVTNWAIPLHDSEQEC
eukprot:m.59317 g.59317  ORF g.59317 m.59317 type:complete len:700 (-) comp11239_c0_seq1:79-2178(-)